MVQPPPPVTANGRPDCVWTRSGLRPITVGKNEEFLAHLRKPLEHRVKAAGGTLDSPAAVSDASHPKSEMSPDSSSPASLAPEDQPSLRQGGSELAEWFSLINPAGGTEGPRLLEPAASVSPAPIAEVADLVERWVRRVALGGDQRRGAVRLDFGEGRLSGAELVVVADGGHVSVELSLPSTLAAPDLSERLRSRLERRGFTADIVVR